MRKTDESIAIKVCKTDNNTHNESCDDYLLHIWHKHIKKFQQLEKDALVSNISYIVSHQNLF